MIYDVLIIGGGPAGLAAAIYAARAGKSVMLFEGGTTGGQISLTASVENYPGVMPIDGFSLTEGMRSQAESFGAQFTYDRVTAIALNSSPKTLSTAYSGDFSGRNVILALGATPKQIGLPRESELVGKGVSYCATCDGHLFKNKTVVVAGGGNSALTDAVYLANLAKKVYIVHRRDEYRAAKILVDRLRSCENVTECLNCTVTALIGSPLSAVELTNTNGEKTVLETNGLFVAIGEVPQTGLVGTALPLENGYIVTDEEMRTGIESVFAVGDVRKKTLRQVVTACADGAIAGNNCI